MIRQIHIIEPGTFTTVQDLGRPSLRGAGVAVGGAVDSVSMRVANALVGNDENAACLECALVGPTIRFRSACRIALCGGRSAGAPLGRAITMRAKQIVSIGPLFHAAYTYLAISGGIDVPMVLGARGTDVRVGIGGHEGRPLRRGDVLRLGPSDLCVSGDSVVNLDAFMSPSAPIRIIHGAQGRHFDPRWIERAFRISSRSDRMGVRLEGERIACDMPAGYESSVVLPGTIQLPPGGEPIVLLADAPTLGGYPQIGHVIEADLPRLAQRRPGSTVRFELYSISDAHRLLQSRERKLALLRYAIGLKVKR